MKPLYHELTERQLAAIKPGSASLIFAGQPGSGRKLAAYRLAQRLNCAAGGGDACAICRNIELGGFADIKVIAGDPGIGIDQIKDLQQGLAQRPFSAETTRLIIIETDGGITPEAQNRLLKTLEEPPAQTALILIAPNLEIFLETVLSRCRTIQFLQPPAERIGQFLKEHLGLEQAGAIGALQPASIGQALVLAGDTELRLAHQDKLRFAQEFVTSPSFDRLVMCGQIKAKAQAQDVIGTLGLVLSRNRLDNLAGFAALETAQQRVAANVSPRAAMEALALSL